jgi:hypothetical protein
MELWTEPLDAAACWRRLGEWANAGCSTQLHLQVLDRLGAQGGLDWSRASVDTMSVGAKRGGPRGRNPVDRGQPGSKLHLVCRGGGLPLTVAVTDANLADTIMFVALLDYVPPIRRPSGRRRTRPAAVHAGKGYDSTTNRAWLRRRGIRPRIARRGLESSTRLGRHRWKVASGRCRGCVASGGCRCPGTGTQGGASPSCWSPARSSAATGSRVAP